MKSCVETMQEIAGKNDRRGKSSGV